MVFSIIDSHISFRLLERQKRQTHRFKALVYEMDVEPTVTTLTN